MLRLIFEIFFMDRPYVYFFVIFLKLNEKCPNTCSDPFQITPEPLKMVFGIKKLIREARKLTKRGQKVYK